jgi:hypothetical protein
MPLKISEGQRNLFKIFPLFSHLNYRFKTRKFQFMNHRFFVSPICLSNGTSLSSCQNLGQNLNELFDATTTYLWPFMYLQTRTHNLSAFWSQLPLIKHWAVFWSWKSIYWSGSGQCRQIISSSRLNYQLIHNM